MTSYRSGARDARRSRVAALLAVLAPLAMLAALALPSLAHAQAAGLPAFNSSPGPNGGTTARSAAS